MTDIALKEALTTFTTVAKAKLNDNNTTAEDMVLIATGLEKLAGRISIVEFEMLVDEMKTVFTDLSTTNTDAYNSLKSAAEDALTNLRDAAILSYTTLSNTKEVDLSDLSSAAETSLSDLSAAKETSLADLSTAKETSLTNLSTAKEASLAALSSAAETSLSAVEAASVSAVQAAGVAPLLTDAIVASTVAYNSKGFVTGYTAGDGKVYSLVTYDAKDRITTWRETVIDPSSSNPVSADFTATYSSSGLLTAISRTII